MTSHSPKNIVRDYFALPRTIWTLFVTETVMAAGSFVYPFLAFVLTRRYGMSEQRVGVLMAVSAVACLVGTLLGGVLADALSRKRALLLTMTVSALAYAAVPCVASVTVVSGLVLVGLATMAATKPAFDALVADLTERDNRRIAFSVLYAAANIGFAVGPLVASLLFANHVTWLFIGDAAATLLAAVLIVLLVPDRFAKSSESRPVERTSSLQLSTQIRQLLVTLREHPAILTLTAVYTINVALFSQVFFAIPLLLSARFGESGAKTYGLVMTLNAILVVVLTPIITSATRRLSPGNCLAIAGVLFACGLGAHGFASSSALVLALVLVWTMGELLNTTNARVFAATLAPSDQRGRVGALVEFAHELGYGIGPVLAGCIIARHGMSHLWPYLAVLGAVTGLTMLLLEWHRVSGFRGRVMRPASQST